MLNPVKLEFHGTRFRVEDPPRDILARILARKMLLWNVSITVSKTVNSHADGNVVRWYDAAYTVVATVILILLAAKFARITTYYNINTSSDYCTIAIITRGPSMQWLA